MCTWGCGMIGWRVRPRPLPQPNTGRERPQRAGDQNGKHLRFFFPCPRTGTRRAPALARTTSFYRTIAK